MAVAIQKGNTGQDANIIICYPELLQTKSAFDMNVLFSFNCHCQPSRVHISQSMGSTVYMGMGNGWSPYLRKFHFQFQSYQSSDGGEHVKKVTAYTNITVGVKYRDT